MYDRKMAVKNKQPYRDTQLSISLTEYIWMCIVYIFSFYDWRAYFHGYNLSASYYTSYFAIEGVKKISLAVTQSSLVFSSAGAQ